VAIRVAFLALAVVLFAILLLSSGAFFSSPRTLRRSNAVRESHRSSEGYLSTATERSSSRSAWISEAGDCLGFPSRRFLLRWSRRPFAPRTAIPPAFRCRRDRSPVGDRRNLLNGKGRGRLDDHDAVGLPARRGEKTPRDPGKNARQDTPGADGAPPRTLLDEGGNLEAYLTG